jgi:hypothetical protein
VKVVLSACQRVQGAAFSLIRILESCTKEYSFIGCFGSNVCTGFNDGNGWIYTREQPLAGWMLPSNLVQQQLDQTHFQQQCNIINEKKHLVCFRR